jgi:NADP-dependent 3-hydroxy acid dehydrogenase YdfG
MLLKMLPGFWRCRYIINNAGISISKPITEHSIADWDKLYDILGERTVPCFKSGIE